MKLGSVMFEEVARILHPAQVDSGEIKGTHPRCGRYRFKRREFTYKGRKSTKWVCVEVERPDRVGA